MEKQRKFARILLLSVLAGAALPGWCLKENSAQPAGKGTVVEAVAPKTVNINTADAATLAAVLKGVGNAKAEAIIAYRKQHGAFKSAEQLAEVKGIGNSLVSRNRDRIVVK